MDQFIVLGLGLVAGILSGLFGIGGGLIIVPTLTLALNLGFKEAAGTSLAALLLPVGALGAYTYWRAGEVNILWACLLALGLFIGAFVGARFAAQVPAAVLGRAFGVLLVAVGVRFTVWGP